LKNVEYCFILIHEPNNYERDSGLLLRAKVQLKMNERDRKIVEKFKSLVSQLVKVHEVRVFGSRARGDATEESDLDVLVVVDYLDPSTERYISDCAWEAGFPEDVIIIPIAISLDTLKNSPIRESVFIKNVYQEGVSV